MLRSLLTTLHRWFGLATAIFLFIAGVTGAIISWDHELDAWLNPELFQARSKHQGKDLLSSLEIANQLEAADARLRVSYLLIQPEAGHTLQMMVEAKPDRDAHLPELGFNQVALDPATGVLQGRRQWGEISLSRENLLPFLYKLHYSMHLPAVSGVETGIWLMGLIAIVWTLDCFIALWLAFPKWSSWRKSLAFRWRQGGYKLNYDLHRSGGVWIWLLLLLLAFTSISMNLSQQVVRPLVGNLSTLSEDAFVSRTPPSPERVREPKFTREQVLAMANAEAQRRGWQLPAGGIFYSATYELYGVGFFLPGNDHGDGGLGNAWLYFDGLTGQAAGGRIPGTGSAGDIFLQAQFPLHSGRILGLGGRIMISFMGVLVAVLCVTGLVIWLKKRKARGLQSIPRTLR
jgi:uncharacterized iron-regulated membrane protein